VLKDAGHGHEVVPVFGWWFLGKGLDDKITFSNWVWSKNTSPRMGSGATRLMFGTTQVEKCMLGHVLRSKEVL
jgi:hypothetical protein